MAKLHELLAVNGNATQQAVRIATEIRALFTGKRHHFLKSVTVSRPLNEADGGETVEEQSEIQTTVNKELRWALPILAEAMDINHQIVVGNLTAKADIVMPDGTVLLAGVPAQTLLELEKQMGKIKEILDVVPTLDPAKGYSRDDSMGEGIYAAREVTKTRTKKIVKPFVKYEATKEHPAQVDIVSEDVPVATVTTKSWSGELTVEQKASMLERLDVMTRAIKAARSRANENVVDPKLPGNKIGETLLKKIFGV